VSRDIDAHVRTTLVVHQTVYRTVQICFVMRHNVVTTHGGSIECLRHSSIADIRQLSREEEEEIGDENEVRKEDQDKINRFSRIHSRHKILDNELKTKQVRSARCQNVLIKLMSVTEAKGGSRRDLYRTRAR